MTAAEGGGARDADGEVEPRAGRGGARACSKRAPFSRPPLRYLYAAGWITRPADAGECVLREGHAGRDAGRSSRDSIRSDAAAPSPACAG